MQNAALKRIADTIRQTSMEIGRRSNDSSVDSMREIVALRRSLQEQLSTLMRAVDDAIATDDTGKLAKHRSSFASLAGSFRSSLAELQSDWPSVSIRQDPAGYAVQRAKLAEAEEKFFNWLVGDFLRKS